MNKTTVVFITFGYAIDYRIFIFMIHIFTKTVMFLYTKQKNYYCHNVSHENLKKFTRIKVIKLNLSFEKIYTCKMCFYFY